MKNMTLTTIASVCNGQLFNHNDNIDKEIAGVVIDSRQVEKDYLFIATIGERVDGHNFIDNVFDKGALAVICEKSPKNTKIPYILVADSFIALKAIAKWYRMQLDIKVIGITGSVGKTTTKEFVSSVLSKKYKVLKTEGNYNNEVGMPLTILKIRDTHQVAVLEMGISDFGEMHRLSEIAKPDISVITNIGPCHLENLGSREGVLKAKTEIFDFLSENGKVVINGDDDLLATIGEVKGSKPIKFGMNADNEIFTSNIVSQGLFGSKVDINTNNQTFHVNLSLPGNHMIYNAMTAASIGILLDVPLEDIVAGIEEFKPIGGRSNIISLEKNTIIDDCYNANPASMRAAIDLLTMADTKKVAILGDMFELGDEENNLHKEIGAYASNKVDLLICVGKLSSYMYDGALENLIGELLYFETRDELIEVLPSIIKKGDTILVKASNGMGFDQVVKALNK